MGHFSALLSCFSPLTVFFLLFYFVSSFQPISHHGLFNLSNKYSKIIKQFSVCVHSFFCLVFSLECKSYKKIRNATTTTTNNTNKDLFRQNNKKKIKSYDIKEHREENNGRNEINVVEKAHLLQNTLIICSSILQLGFLFWLLGSAATANVAAVLVPYLFSIFFFGKNSIVLNQFRMF